MPLTKYAVLYLVQFLFEIFVPTKYCSNNNNDTALCGTSPKLVARIY